MVPCERGVEVRGIGRYHLGERPSDAIAGK
jgi:hypothetical protein